MNSMMITGTRLNWAEPMNTMNILRSAALMVSFAAYTAGAGAQTLTALEAQPELVAMTSARELDVNEVETRAARGERIVEAVAAVKGFEADAEVRAAIEVRVSEVDPEAKVLRAVLTSDRWSVKVTELGMPKSEYRRGVVIYRVPGQDAVIEQQIVVERPYFALSEADRRMAVRLGTPRSR